MRVLILGASGMLGYAMLHRLAASGLEVHGTVRRIPASGEFFLPHGAVLHEGVDATDMRGMRRLLSEIRPARVINCAGVIKQLDVSPEDAVSVNALLPHRLASACTEIGARLVHFSTDCVFSGKRGRYAESDLADADDLYGRSKRLGEVTYGGHLTLRTSLIGHELRTGVSLVDWFLSRTGPVQGYRHAIFSGLPTPEVARVVAEVVLPRDTVEGLYHLAAAPIDKLSLLTLIGDAYGHRIEIQPADEPRIDRSLDGSRFRALTNYVAPDWPELVGVMHRYFLETHNR